MGLSGSPFLCGKPLIADRAPPSTSRWTLLLTAPACGEGLARSSGASVGTAAGCLASLDTGGFKAALCATQSLPMKTPSPAREERGWHSCINSDNSQRLVRGKCGCWLLNRSPYTFWTLGTQVVMRRDGRLRPRASDRLVNFGRLAATARGSRWCVRDITRRGAV